MSTCCLAEPFLKSELIFAPEHWHNHSSSIVELPDGDLLACWYNGSGERTADDVKVEAARMPKGSGRWSGRFTLVDTPGFPDTNPALFVDKDKRLWLLWPVIIANEWHTALMEYRIASKYPGPGVPRWDIAQPLLLKPAQFAEQVTAAVSQWPETVRAATIAKAKDRYFSRMGWMTRAHPVQLPSGRIIVPLYSDGYDFSLMTLTDDGGKTWSTSNPVVGPGAVQPTVVRRRDGSLVAYMRDNGPPPKRVLMSTSKDEGVTWTGAADTSIPNPGSGLEAIVLRDGRWVMIYNDTEKGRHSLAVSLSADEGATWSRTRHLELDNSGRGAGSFHYPSIVQARDGSMHATYSQFLNLPEGARKSIKHAHFNTEWVEQGDPKP